MNNIFSSTASLEPLIVNSNSKDVITKEIMQDIVGSGLTKSQILQKYGQRVYNEFVDKARFTIGALGIQNTVNKTLLNDVLQDTLVSVR